MLEISLNSCWLQVFLISEFGAFIILFAPVKTGSCFKVGSLTSPEFSMIQVYSKTADLI